MSDTKTIFKSLKNIKKQLFPQHEMHPKVPLGVRIKIIFQRIKE